MRTGWHYLCLAMITLSVYAEDVGECLACLPDSLSNVVNVEKLHSLIGLGTETAPAACVCFAAIVTVFTCV